MTALTLPLQPHTDFRARLRTIGLAGRADCVPAEPAAAGGVWLGGAGDQPGAVGDGQPLAAPVRGRLVAVLAFVFWVTMAVATTSATSLFIDAMFAYAMFGEIVTQQVDCV